MGGAWHRWTEEDEDIVRRDYTGNGDSIRELSARLNIGENAIKGLIQRRGWTKSKVVHWSPEDDDRLKSLLEHYSVGIVAKRMKRSKTACATRAKRLGISLRDKSGHYSAREAAEILGVDAKWVTSRIASGSLKATSFYGGPVQGKGASQWRIDEKDLASFIRRYASELTGRNVDLMAIVDILCGLQYP